MQYRLPRPIIFSFLLGLVLLSGTAIVRAQGTSVANLEEIQRAAIGLTALPPRLGEDGSLTGEPGATIQTQVRVRNVSTQPIVIQTLAEDFVIGEDGRTPVPVDVQVDTKFSLANWIEIPVRQATIQPGGIQTIPLVIRVPANARPGGRYAMIMHQPVVSTGEEFGADLAGQAAVNERVGTLVYFRVPGPVHEEAAIRNIVIPGFSEFGPVPITFDIENLSDIHIRPLVNIEIRNILGRTVDTVTVETQNVFPDSLRRFEANWDRVWGFGRYSARFNVSYGDQGQVLTATAAFWLFPYRLIVAILVVILVLIATGVLIRRHLKYRGGVEEQHIGLLEDRIRQLENELHEKDTH
jgi:hypothetical protein